MEDSPPPAAKRPCTVVNWDDVASSSSASRQRKEEEDRLLMPPPPPRTAREDSKGKRGLSAEDLDRQAKAAQDAKLAEWRKVCADIESGTSEELLPARMERVQRLTAELHGMGVDLETARDQDQDQGSGELALGEPVADHVCDSVVQRVTLQMMQMIAAEQAQTADQRFMRALENMEHMGVRDCLASLYHTGEAGVKAGNALMKLLRADESRDAMVQTWDLHALCSSDAGGGVTGLSALDTLLDILKVCMSSPEDSNKRHLAVWSMDQLAPFRRAPGCLGAGALQLLAVARCAARQTLGNVVCNM